MSKKTFTILIIIFVAIALGIGYFLFVKGPGAATTDGGETNTDSGFSPFTRGGTTIPPRQGTSATSTATNGTQSTPIEAPKIPTLRQLYATPVGGMGATTTAITATTSRTVLRFIDRGTGHVYEAPADSLDINKLSNTTLSKVYESFWNKSATAFILRYMKNDNEAITTFYAELRQVVGAASSTASSTGANTTKYELRGKYLNQNITDIAVSPKRDKIFELSTENGRGVGYVASFDERTRLQMFDTPIAQANIEWPEENTLSITTKGSAFSPGYLYFFDIKKGVMKKVLGAFRGLSTLTSRDGGKVFYSQAVGQTVKNYIYTVKDGSSQDVVFRTLPEKCVWSDLHKEDLYCAVPTGIPADDSGYPDAWYQGKTSFIDTIWHIDANTGEVHQIANLVSDSGKLIDATNLTLDPKENILYFINKKDLSLWSLDISR